MGPTAIPRRGGVRDPLWGAGVWLGGLWRVAIGWGCVWGRLPAALGRAAQGSAGGGTLWGSERAQAPPGAQSAEQRGSVCICTQGLRVSARLVPWRARAGGDAAWDRCGCGEPAGAGWGRTAHGASPASQLSQSRDWSPPVRPGADAHWSCISPRSGQGIGRSGFWVPAAGTRPIPTLLPPGLLDRAGRRPRTPCPSSNWVGSG